MTREKAVEIFKERLDVARTYFDVHGIEDYTQAMELAVEVLSQEPSTDLISRQAALSIIECYDGDRAMRDALEDLPSAQPEPESVGCSGCRYERFGNRVCYVCSRFYADRYEAERRTDE